MSATTRAPEHCRPRAGEDACPGVLRIHRALDGGLARIRIPGGRTSPAQLSAIADCARLGSGIVEITSRGNLQLRGLPGDAGAALGERLAAAGLVPSFPHERARNVIASPLAGRHPAALAAVDEIVAGLDGGLCADPSLAELSGRFCFGVEDGSGAITGRQYDVLLTPAGAEFALMVGGTDTFKRAAPTAAAELALAAARAFLAERGGDAKVWRVSDLSREGPAAATSPPAPARILPGRLRQRDGLVAVTAHPPLGRLDPARLERLAGVAAGERTDVRFSPWRTLSLVDLDPLAAPAVERELGALGLVLDPTSGWHGLSACAGLGGCERALADVRAAAARRAELRPPDAPAEHWTACERRCGERAEIPVAVAVTASGVEVRDRDGVTTVADLDTACAALGGGGAG